MLLREILTNTTYPFFLSALKTAFNMRIYEDLTFLKVWNKPYFDRSIYQ